MDNSDDNALVAQILSSYLSNNTVPDLSSVIESVKRAFNGGTVSAPLLAAEAHPQKRQPAVLVKRSVSPDELHLLMLRRRIQTAQASFAIGASAYSRGISHHL